MADNATPHTAAWCPDGRVCTENCGDRLCVYEYATRNRVDEDDEQPDCHYCRGTGLSPHSIRDVACPYCVPHVYRVSIFGDTRIETPAEHEAWRNRRRWWQFWRAT